MSDSKSEAKKERQETKALSNQFILRVAYEGFEAFGARRYSGTVSYNAEPPFDPWEDIKAVGREIGILDEQNEPIENALDYVNPNKASFWITSRDVFPAGHISESADNRFRRFLRQNEANEPNPHVPTPDPGTKDR